MDRLVKDIEPWKLKGLKVSIIGFLVVCTGFLLFILDLDLLGRIIIYTSFAVTFIGMAMHFYIMFKGAAKKGRKKRGRRD